MQVVAKGPYQGQLERELGVLLALQGMPGVPVLAVPVTVHGSIITRDVLKKLTPEVMQLNDLHQKFPSLVRTLQMIELPAVHLS